MGHDVFSGMDCELCVASPSAIEALAALTASSRAQMQPEEMNTSCGGAAASSGWVTGNNVAVRACSRATEMQTACGRACDGVLAGAVEADCWVLLEYGPMMGRRACHQERLQASKRSWTQSNRRFPEFEDLLGIRSALLLVLVCKRICVLEACCHEA